SLYDAVALALQEIAEAEADGLLVVDDQDLGLPRRCGIQWMSPEPLRRTGTSGSDLTTIHATPLVNYRQGFASRRRRRLARRGLAGGAGGGSRPPRRAAAR